MELWLGDKPWFKMDTSDAGVRDLLRKVHDAGLIVSNVANSLDWDENLSSRDPRVQAAARRHIERQIETAQLLQTDAILVVAGVVTEAVPYNEVYRRCVESLRSLGERAAQAKVRIGCENCNSEQRFLFSPREFWQFLNEINHPSDRDSFGRRQHPRYRLPGAVDRNPGARITRVHLKDVMRHRGRCGDQSVYTNIFLGDNNWPAIRTALDKVGYNGWLIAEMEAHYRFAPDQQFFDTAAAMDRFITGRF